MSVEVGAVVEAFGTHGAGEGLLAGVDPHMDGQVLPVAELLVAHVAHLKQGKR